MAYKALIYRYLFIKSNGLFEEIKKQLEYRGYQ